MRRKPLFVMVVVTLLVMLTGPLALSAPASLPDKYMNAARIMGDWLIENIDPVLGSWASPWEPGRTDATSSFHGIRQVAILSDITGDPVYRDAARRVADSWIDKAFISSLDEISDWNWALGDTVGKLEWTDEDFAKVQGGFASGFWAEKDGHAWVRSPETPFCAGIVKPLLALLEFGDEYDDVIKIMSGWFNTDRVNKRRYSDDELSFSAYMTSQSYSDDDGDGFADIDYILWGTRRQSAGMNSRSISAFLALGMKDEAIQTAEWLINVMWDEEEGRFDAIYDFGAGTSLSLEESGDIGCVNASIASGLLTVYEATGDRKYLDYATAALDWVIEHETAFEITPCGIRVYFTKPAVYGTHQVVAGLAHAYEVTGRTNYLVYAIAGADWLIDQMEDPFAGFGNNPWSVVEVLQAVEAVLSLDEVIGAQE
ncbi:MAG TPA: glycoside hydrolase family 88 protein [Bacillota bacterium]|nr:glycoside hydrolase family 88 protein [Bacillota bacterium]HOL02885.1 glycoside hydrolase family 88 protein [Bacillota bacterium]HPO80832.1 glycoside hydrolase family 88 protein [Bacillota bacterium]